MRTGWPVMLPNTVPMSRSYALALMLTGLAVLGSLVYLQHYLIVRNYQQLFDHSIEIHERVVARQLEQQENFVQKMQDLLEDEAKARFRPLLPFCDGIQERQEACLQLAQKIQQGQAPAAELLEELVQLQTANLLKTREAYAVLLFKHGEDFGYRKTENVTSVAKVEDIRAATAESLRKVITNRAQVPAASLAGLLLTDYLQAEQQVMEMAGNLSGGKMLTCFFGPEFYPIVASDKIKTVISVGSFAFGPSPEDFTLVVAGDSLKLAPDGSVRYTFQPERRGQQDLEVKLFLTNHLTGEVRQQATSTSSYFIR